MYSPDDMPVPVAFTSNDWTPPPHVAGAPGAREDISAAITLRDHPACLRRGAARGAGGFRLALGDDRPRHRRDDPHRADARHLSQLRAWRRGPALPWTGRARSGTPAPADRARARQGAARADPRAAAPVEGRGDCQDRAKARPEHLRPLQKKHLPRMRRPARAGRTPEGRDRPRERSASTSRRHSEPPSARERPEPRGPVPPTAGPWHPCALPRPLCPG